jgi:SAM-dependent methyltransferase
MTRYHSGYEKAAHLYDLFDCKENIEFFYHYARQVSEILDIGAGTGRVAIPLAERGVNVYCVEPSPAMRHEFKKKLALRPELKKRITLVAADASSFRFERKFPAAFLSGCFDHFLDDNQRLASLNNIADHLEFGGKLIFDVFLGLLEERPCSPGETIKSEGFEYHRHIGRKRLVDNTQETHLIFETYKAGELVEQVEEDNLVGVISWENILRLLGKAGFRVNRAFSNYNFTPYQEESPLLIIEARKISAT